MPTNRLTRTRSSNARAQQNSPRSKRQSGSKGDVATQRRSGSRTSSRSASRSASRGSKTSQARRSTGRTTSQARRTTGRGTTSRSRSAGRKSAGRGTSAAGAQRGQEIPRNQWTSFLNRFSREHDGWLARVDVSETGTRGGTEARLMPLLGVSIDMKPGAKDTTSIMLDVRPNVHLTHWVPRTKQVIFNEQEQILRITSTTGDRAVVRLEKKRRVGWA